MPAGRPAHRFMLPHANVASDKVWVMTAFTKRRLKTSPTSTGQTPGCLSIAMRRHAIIAQYTDQEGEVFVSHSVQRMSSLSRFSETTLKQNIQCRRSMALMLLGAALPESFRVVNLKLS